MKTAILLFGFVLFLTSFLQAQIERGRVQIGGSVGFFHQKLGINAYKNTNVNLSPSVGIFYKTNQLVGTFLNYTYNEYSNSSDSNYAKEIMRNYGMGIYFRQYKSVAQKLYLFFDERGSFNFINETTNFAVSHKYSLDCSFQPGLAYDVTRNLQLEIALNNLLNAYYSNGSATSTFALSSSLESNLASNIRVGFRFYLK